MKVGSVPSQIRSARLLCFPPENTWDLGFIYVLHPKPLSQIPRCSTIYSVYLFVNVKFTRTRIFSQITREKHVAAITNVTQSNGNFVRRSTST